MYSILYQQKLKRQITKDRIDNQHKESSFSYNLNMNDIILKGGVKWHSIYDTLIAKFVEGHIY